MVDHLLNLQQQVNQSLVSNWSGYKDFLPEENTVYLEGELKRSTSKPLQNKFLLKESKWFYVDYSKAAW